MKPKGNYKTGRLVLKQSLLVLLETNRVGRHDAGLQEHPMYQSPMIGTFDNPPTVGSRFFFKEADGNNVMTTPVKGTRTADTGVIWFRTVQSTYELQPGEGV